MNWNAKDIDLYLKERLYVDTAVIPLLPITFGEGMKQTAEQAEFIQLLALHLERQFKGRMLFIPPFTYLDTMEGAQKAETLDKWTEEARSSGFSTVFLLTSDSGWKPLESKVKGSLLWLPSVPFEHMEDQYKHSIIESQVKQLLAEIVRHWQSV
ncbi:MAG TPA: YpiF family protein [Bacillaceae bacterium]